MQLTLKVPDHFHRLLDASERRALESVLSLALGWCRIESMRDGGKVWRRGGNGHSEAFGSIRKDSERGKRGKNGENGESIVGEHSGGNGHKKQVLTELPDDVYEGALCSVDG